MFCVNCILIDLIKNKGIREKKRLRDKRRLTNGQWVHKKALDITNHQGNANQNHSKISPHTCENGCIKNRGISVEENVEKREPSYTVGGNAELVQPPWKTV